MGIPTPTISVPSSEIYAFDGSGQSTIDPSSFKDKRKIARGQQFLGQLSTDGGINLLPTPLSPAPAFIHEASAIQEADGTSSPYGIIAPRRSTCLHSGKDTSVASNSTPWYSLYVAPVAARVPRRKSTAPAPEPSPNSGNDSDSGGGESSRSSSNYNITPGSATSYNATGCAMLRCGSCGESFSRWSDVQRHHHCDLCDDIFTRGIDVERHVNSFHNNITFPCPRCGDRTSRKDAVARHLLRMARRCPHCEEVFLRRCELPRTPRPVWGFHGWRRRPRKDGREEG